MSSLKAHCEESMRLFGKTYAEVHQWLDAFAGTVEFGYKHRKKRHHEEGIRKVCELFGADVAEVARRHIISDLKEEGWTEDVHFPKNERDYVDMGLY